MARKKHLKDYEKLAQGNGTEPLAYLWKRLHYYNSRGDHTKAEAIAATLLPYGHSKKAPTDKDGQAVETKVKIVLT